MRQISRRLAAAAAVTAFAATGVGYALASPPVEQRTAESAPMTAVPDDKPAAPAAPAGPTVHEVTAAELGETWSPGCPVGPEALRRVDLDYISPDGDTRRGALVVHKDYVDDAIAIFDDLKRLRYPIAKMQTVEVYPGAEDELSMRDNNTSAFNCRPLGDGWSLHAYGRAIDINPLINPYIDSAGDLQPKTAGRYLDRTLADPAMLKAGDPAVRAFTDRGWRWGGAWRNPVDYQHFEIG